MQNRYYMKDEVPFSDFPVYAEKASGSSRAIIILFVIVFIIAGVLGGLYFLGKSQQSGSGGVVVTPTDVPTPTKAPATTPTATASGTLTPSPSAGSLDRSDLSIAVLNGSGVRGAANATATTLRNLGYTVGSTGNAERFNYTGISILIKKAKNNYTDQLKKDLNASGASVTTDDTISTDAVVIVGR